MPRMRGARRAILTRDIRRRSRQSRRSGRATASAATRSTATAARTVPISRTKATKHDAATLRRWIVDPEQVDPDADMPSFGDRLTAAQLDAISELPGVAEVTERTESFG